MAFFGPLLAAMAAGGGMLLESGNQKTANNIAAANLNETRRSNRERENLAKANREDAYGNVVRFDPGAGFTYDLTDFTRDILDAEQIEQLASLREDAPRQRAAAVRRDERSQVAEEDFDKLLTEFRFSQRPNRRIEQANARRDAAEAARSGGNAVKEAVGRTLLRSGNTSNAGNILRQITAAETDRFGELMTSARRAGDESFSRLSNDRLSGIGRELQLLQSIADGTTTTPIAQPTIGTELSNRGSGALQQLLQVLSQNNQASQNAYGNLQRAAGQSPNVNPLVSALRGIRLPQQQPAAG